MTPPVARRLLLLALLSVVVAALAWALFAQPWRTPTPESHMRDVAEKLRDKVRELTR